MIKTTYTCDKCKKVSDKKECVTDVKIVVRSFKSCFSSDEEIASIHLCDACVDALVPVRLPPHTEPTPERVKSIEDLVREVVQRCQEE